MLYYYYQKEGGDEAWSVTQADYIEDVIRADRPTFISALQINTVLPEKPTKDQLDNLRYQGPFYMDLDDASDVTNSIEDAKVVVQSLIDAGLEDTDIEVYLTGKKGLHLMVQPEAFMQKVTPVKGLPLIYKDVAFRFAAQTTDFRVYSARRDRMFRTCYRQRENGNWRVPITVEELRELTTEQYYVFCGQQPRNIIWKKPSFRPRFAIIYDEASQKFTSTKKRKAPAVNATTLKAHEPIVDEVVSGIGVADVGFNRIAIQVCLYAREARWSEDYLIERCAGLIANHRSDGGRYNTDYKRERHLREMFYYVEDNPSYEYSVEGLKHLLSKYERNAENPEGGEEELPFTGGVTRNSGFGFFADRGEAGSVRITNFDITDVKLLLDFESNAILGITASLEGDSTVNKTARVNLFPQNFTSSSALHNALSAYGCSFTGTDVHARGVYQIMLREVSGKRYLIDTEGLSVVHIPGHAVEDLRKPFVVWADRYGVRVPNHIRDMGVEFEFQGYPEPTGVFQTDISKAPSLRTLLESEDGIYRIEQAFSGLFGSQSPDSVGKVLGWAVACFWRPIFNLYYSKFPLLHVYGPAGSGKSEFMKAMLSLFYYNSDPKITSPTSTPFSFLTFLGGSESIPILMDEYKPSKMKETIEKYRGYFRDSYNMKETQRGGGNRTKDNYNALNVTKLSAPICFIAESMETETAIVERMVLVTLRRHAPSVYVQHYFKFMDFVNNRDVFSCIGHTLAAGISKSDLDKFREEFDGMLAKAQNDHMLRKGDLELVQSGAMSDEEYTRRAGNKQRNVFNSTVAYFGLQKMRNVLQHIFKERFDELFGDYYSRMEVEIYNSMDAIARSTSPEYIKTLSSMSDLTRVEEAQFKLVQGTDYDLVDIGGKVLLVLAYRTVYSKYRAYQRWASNEPYFNNDSAFLEGLIACPQFHGNREAIGKHQGLSVVTLSYSDLMAQGMSPWSGKVSAAPAT